MSLSLRATPAGLLLVDRARQRRGWTKTSTARWWQEAHTSRATLRRFWQGDRIQRDSFIALCEVVGVADWEAIAAPWDADELGSGVGSGAGCDSQAVALPGLLAGDERPDLDSFYGRGQALEQLVGWLRIERVKVVVISGFIGVGKTALALALVDQVQMDRVQPEFDRVIWRSLQMAPSLLGLLNGLLTQLGQEAVTQVEVAIAQLLMGLKQRRYLLVLDGLEEGLSLACQTEMAQLLRQLAQQSHQSCVVITAREQPEAIAVASKFTRCLTLQGLSLSDGSMLLRSLNLTGKPAEQRLLLQLYRGNPLLLKLAAPLMQSLFGGCLVTALQQKTLILGPSFQSLLQQQFQQLSELERDLLYWLAIWQEPITLSRLQSHWLPTPDPAILLAAIAVLDRRSLVEKWLDAASAGAATIALTLAPAVMQWVTERLVERVVQEVEQAITQETLCSCKLLRSHYLLRPGTDEIRGDRIIQQIRNQLLRLYGEKWSEIWLELLDGLDVRSSLAIGYLKCNGAALLL